MIWGPSSFNGGDWVFQPKNNPLIKDFFQENKVTLLYYPDLNPIENVWGWKAREVYKSGRRFQSVDALREAPYGATFPKAAWKHSHQACLNKCLKLSTTLVG